MTEFEWDPASYLALMAEEIPDYTRLQTELTEAATAPTAPESATDHAARPSTILDLGVGSGLTATKVLDTLPEAKLLGIDASAQMLAAARTTLDPQRTELREGRLEDPLPPGPFDLVMSTLAVHHLGAEGKADLFARIAEVLSPGGRFVLADLVVPDDPAEVVTPIDWVEDTPSSLEEQLGWLAEAGLNTRVHWKHKDLAVVVGEKSAQD
ncbi:MULTISPECIES: class I SAM-dependent methyltransferase [unclassified Brevibacterium]|uniref:class I SAM-dependent methyltransferase n=1 Tax=unclassified Brevibacterium TaxID=2614124 RepID=UPI001E5088DC|nr:MULTISPECIES: class I SAM-dependent methyltransferase [unclassified Brevibacterium]MCD1286850.1 class I SAM-dependent methyltransferase [Brevibacterium sp. CCUG 69071]MDK8433913.1 class I SAM-dependent methyltransferase [Brevibacterium sp. H-BE7]